MATAFTLFALPVLIVAIGILAVHVGLECPALRRAATSHTGHTQQAQ